MEQLQEDGAESVLVKLAQLKEQQAQLRQVILLLLASRSHWVWLLGPPGASGQAPRWARAAPHCICTLCERMAVGCVFTLMVFVLHCQEMETDHVRQGDAKIKKKLRKKSPPRQARAWERGYNSRIASYANPQRLFALAAPHRRAQSAERLGGDRYARMALSAHGGVENVHATMCSSRGGAPRARELAQAPTAAPHRDASAGRSAEMSTENDVPLVEALLQLLAREQASAATAKSSHKSSAHADTAWLAREHEQPADRCINRSGCPDVAATAAKSATVDVNAIQPTCGRMPGVAVRLSPANSAISSSLQLRQEERQLIKDKLIRAEQTLEADEETSKAHEEDKGECAGQSSPLIHNRPGAAQGAAERSNDLVACARVHCTEAWPEVRDAVENHPSAKQSQERHPEFVDEKAQLLRRVYELEALLEQSHSRFIQVDQENTATQAHARLLQSKLSLLQQEKDADFVALEHARLIKEAQAREHELLRTLNEAKKARLAVVDELEVMRESLKQTQNDLETTRKLLRQQSEDHGKVLQVLHRRLRDAQEQERERAAAGHDHHKTIEKLQRQVTALHVAQEVELPEWKQNAQAQQQTKLRPIADMQHGISGNPEDADEEIEKVSKADIVDKGPTESSDYQLREDQLQSEASAVSSTVLPHAGKRASQKDQDSTKASFNPAIESSGTDHDETTRLRQNIAELRGELSSYKNAVKRLDSEISTLKQFQTRSAIAPQSVCVPVRDKTDLVTGNSAMNSAPTPSSTSGGKARKPALPIEAKGNRVQAIPTSARTADIAMKLKVSDQHDNSFSVARDIEPVLGGDYAQLSVNRVKEKKKRTRVTVPAHVKAEAAAKAEAEALAAAIRSTPIKPRLPKFAPKPHPRPKSPSEHSRNSVSERPPWLGVKQSHISKPTVPRTSPQAVCPVNKTAAQRQSRRLGDKNAGTIMDDDGTTITTNRMIRVTSSKAPKSATSPVRQEKCRGHARKGRDGKRDIPSAVAATTSIASPNAAWLDEEGDTFRPAGSDLLAHSAVIESNHMQAPVSVSTFDSDDSLETNTQDFNAAGETQERQTQQKEPDETGSKVRVDAGHAVTSPMSSSLNAEGDSLDEHSDDRPPSPDDAPEQVLAEAETSGADHQLQALERDSEDDTEETSSSRTSESATSDQVD